MNKLKKFYNNSSISKKIYLQTIVVAITTLLLFAIFILSSLIYQYNYAKKIGTESTANTDAKLTEILSKYNVDNSETSQLTNLINENNQQIINSIENNIYIVLILSMILIALLIFITYKSSKKLSKKIAKPINEIANQLEISKINNNRTDAELQIASEIQTGFLAKPLPAFPHRNDVLLYADMIPANVVGGDLYDYFEIDDDHIALVIADVSGKGISAAMFMLVTKTILENQAKDNSNPKSVLSNANKILATNNEAGMFATCFFVVINTKTGDCEYANAGHNLPIIVRNNSNITEFIGDVKSVPLGIFEDTKYQTGKFHLDIDDRLIMYTDGVTDTFNDHNQEYGTDNLVKFIDSRQFTKISTITATNALVRDLQIHSKNTEQFDDITVLLFARTENNSFHQINITPEIECLNDILLFLDANISHVQPATRNNIELIVDEVFANIVNYSFKDVPDYLHEIVSVGIDFQSDNIELKFIYGGTAFDPTKSTTTGLSEDISKRDIGGLGIHIIKQLSTSLKYERTNEKNIFIVNLKDE
ncbi:MAG: SpoIIE family protein phosphatase [Bifidobacteriaceae bacterium]|nr:SpoIIE family protein phosphatase [Bifidobacteriaceae bacterium]